MQLYFGVDPDLRSGPNPRAIDYAAQLYTAVRDAGPLDNRVILLYKGGYNGIDFGIWDGNDITFLDDPDLLTDHIAKVTTDIPLYVPADFNGLIVIDLESTTWNLYNYPGVGGYLEKIKAYMLATIAKVQELRPNARVSWYGYPYALGDVYEQPANVYSARNDEISWLFRAMDFIAPAPYRVKRRRDESETGTPTAYEWTPAEHQAYVRANMAEFRRIGTNNKRPVIIHECASRIGDNLPEGSDFLTEKEIDEMVAQLRGQNIEGLIWWGLTGSAVFSRSLQDWWRSLYFPLLQKYALAANNRDRTKLNFVNRLLLSVGRPRVSQLKTGQIDDAGLAEAALDWAELQVQSGAIDGQGWWHYNTRRSVTLTVQPDGSIVIPSYIVDTTEAYDEPLEFTKIGSNLVNLDPAVTGFADAETVTGDLCIRYHIECCPVEVQYAIVAVAAEHFYGNQHQKAGYDRAIHQRIIHKAEVAVRAARNADTRKRRTNIINPVTVNQSTRYPRTTDDTL